PGSRRELGGHPRGNLQVGDVVDSNLHPVLVAPLLGELVIPDVVGGNEVTPLEDSQGRPLDLGGRLPRVEHRHQASPCDPGPSDMEEAPTAGGGRTVTPNGCYVAHREAPPYVVCPVPWAGPNGVAVFRGTQRSEKG